MTAFLIINLIFTVLSVIVLLKRDLSIVKMNLNMILDI